MFLLLMNLLMANWSFAGLKSDIIEEQILGQWTYEGKHSGSKIRSVATFKPEGRYACSMTVSFLGVQTKISFEATWEVVDDDDVVIKVTKSSNKLLMPVGKVMKKEGVSFQNDVMTYQHDGKAEKETRAKPEPDKEVTPC
jgi:hypothetical protein